MLPSTGRSARSWLAAAVFSLAAAVPLAGCGQEESPSLVAIAPPPAHSRIAEEEPPHPLPPYDVAPEAKPEPASKPRVPSDPATMPPASAGSNGSYVPLSRGGEEITPRTMAKLAGLASSESAVLLRGIALAPPSAPERIKAAISAANTIVGRPYVWGGGHSSWYSRGYDCSGAVSYALAGGGLLPVPLTSSELMSWGAPGPGRWLTVYANPGHTYAVIAGLRWDTVGDATGTGPRWHPALPYAEGFVARHPPGF